MQGGLTALIGASARGHLDTTTLLLANAAEVDAQNYVRRLDLCISYTLIESNVFMRSSWGRPN